VVRVRKKVEDKKLTYVEQEEQTEIDKERILSDKRMAEMDRVRC
jgi:hypothetical protein